MIQSELMNPYATRGELRKEVLQLLQKDAAYIGVGEVKDQQVISWFSQSKSSQTNEQSLQYELKSWSMLWRLLTQSIPESRNNHHRLSFMCLIHFNGKECYLVSTRLLSKHHLILITEKTCMLERTKFWLDRTANCIDGRLKFSSTAVSH